eukprot:6218036-Prymnesium_polylepis.1
MGPHATTQGHMSDTRSHGLARDHTGSHEATRGHMRPHGVTRGSHGGHTGSYCARHSPAMPPAAPMAAEWSTERYQSVPATLVAWRAARLHPRAHNGRGAAL